MIRLMKCRTKIEEERSTILHKQKAIVRKKKKKLSRTAKIENLNFFLERERSKF